MTRASQSLSVCGSLLMPEHLLCLPVHGERARVQEILNKKQGIYRPSVSSSASHAWEKPPLPLAAEVSDTCLSVLWRVPVRSGVRGPDVTWSCSLRRPGALTSSQALFSPQRP